MQFRVTGRDARRAAPPTRLMVMEFQLEFAFFMGECGNERILADSDEHQSVLQAAVTARI